MEEIKGIYAATLSVLDKNLALDIKNTIKHAENVIDMGCNSNSLLAEPGGFFVVRKSKHQKASQLSFARCKCNPLHR